MQADQLVPGDIVHLEEVRPSTDLLPSSQYTYHLILFTRVPLYRPTGQL